jgi:hypothetical protein
VAKVTAVDQNGFIGDTRSAKNRVVRVDSFPIPPLKGLYFKMDLYDEKGETVEYDAYSLKKSLQTFDF